MDEFIAKSETAYAAMRAKTVDSLIQTIMREMARVEAFHGLCFGDAAGEDLEDEIFEAIDSRVVSRLIDVINKLENE